MKKVDITCTINSCHSCSWPQSTALGDFDSSFSLPMQNACQLSSLMDEIPGLKLHPDDRFFPLSLHVPLCSILTPSEMLFVVRHPFSDKYVWWKLLSSLLFSQWSMDYNMDYSSSITWELIRNGQSQVPPKPDRIRICILSRSPGGLVLRGTARNFL